MADWPDGPREWSPRLAKAWGQVEQLKAAIPAELQLDRGDLFTVGQTINLLEVGVEGYLKGAIGEKLARVALIVKVGDNFNRVWIYPDGKIAIGSDIPALLNGEIDGFEHLAGRWPWPGSPYGPPEEGA